MGWMHDEGMMRAWWVWAVLHVGVPTACMCAQRTAPPSLHRGTTWLLALMPLHVGALSQDMCPRVLVLLIHHPQKNNTHE